MMDVSQVVELLGGKPFITVYKWQRRKQARHEGSAR